MSDYDGLVALVTGGASGIGAAVVRLLSSRGAQVAVLDRDPGDPQCAALSIPCDVTDPSAVDSAVSAVVERLGRLDVVVNNAATNPAMGPMVDLESRAVRKILEVNLEGPLHLAREAWHGWMRDHGGVILNIASTGGLHAGPFIGMYNVSKAALIHLTKQLALELAPGVRVNAIAPGLVKTDFARALWEPDEPGIAARHPLDRIGVPDDVAGLALFLASDAGSWITGEVYRLDGGLSLL